MLMKLPVVQVGPLAEWLNRGAERRALLKGTDELSHSTNDMLSDIGISRDDIESAFRNPGVSSVEMSDQRGGEQ